MQFVVQLLLPWAEILPFHNLSWAGILLFHNLSWLRAGRGDAVVKQHFQGWQWVFQWGSRALYNLLELVLGSLELSLGFVGRSFFAAAPQLPGVQQFGCLEWTQSSCEWLFPLAYKATENFRPQFSPPAQAKVGLNVLLERQKGPVLLQNSTELPAEINPITSMASARHLSPSKTKGSSANLSQWDLWGLKSSQCTGSQGISDDFSTI